MVHGNNHRARPQEQHGFEEGMGHQMEHTGRIGTGTQRHRHVTQLRKRRVGDNPFNVVLDNGNQGHKECRDRANHKHKRQCSLGQLKQGAHARHHEDTGSHHRCRVDQGRDRRRAFHRIGQPNMQRKLRGFAHRADEQTNTDYRHE